MADLEELKRMISELPQKFEMRKRIHFDGEQWIIYANENDIARFSPEELEESIQYMYKVQDIFNFAGMKCKVETYRW